jgi:type III secretion protein L
MDEKIIKAKVVAEAAGAGLAHKVVPHEIYDAGRKARDLVESARAEARAIIERAERDATAIRETARAEGLEEGLARWNEALVEAGRAQERLLRDCEGELVRLAVRVAEKIVGERLRAAPETIVSIVAEALKSVRRERSLTIQVNPGHAEEIRRRVDRLRAVVGASREIEIVPNDSVAPGGCIVETELGVIDAQLETQLRCLENALRRTPGQ